VIRVILTGVNWGVDPIEEGRQINLLDPESKIMYHVPFTADSLVKLIAELAKGLDSEQRRALMPVFNGGIELPGRDFKPDDIIKGRPIKDDPQG
jgi:hypothetical protein